MTTYIKEKTWSKSKTLLFPLLYNSRNIKDICYPTAVYSIFIIDNDEYYNINNQELTCIYNKKNKKDILNEDTPIKIIKPLNNDEVAIVYDLKKYKEVCNLFIEGKYSQFPENIKKHIYKFYNTIGSNKIWNPKEEGVIIDLILYPSKYWEAVSKELDIDYSKLKKIGELSSPPDFMNQETLHL